MVRRRWLTSLLVLALIALLSVGGWFLTIELRTSAGQARLFSAVARDLTYHLGEGPNPDLRWPRFGPYNERLGYKDLPSFLQHLTDNGYTVERQARWSRSMDRFVALTGHAVYREKARTGLTLLDRSGRPMFTARYPQRLYRRFEDVPRLIVDTLLYIENRELLDPSQPRRNPAVEWDRFAGAVLSLPARWLHPGLRIAGGSTLATQIEKYRHSPDGQTVGATEKLRQMLSASLRVYRDGEYTAQARRRIVVDYLNSTPLTARPGFGEINGLGDGLWAWYGADLSAVGRDLRELPGDPATMTRQAIAYRQVLSLLLAQRRPSYYLGSDPEALARLVDTHLTLLADAGLISPDLRAAALATRLQFRDSPPTTVTTDSFVLQKAPNAVRARLLSLLGVPSLYQLDRFDMTVESTLDNEVQRQVVEVLAHLGDKQFTKSLGLTGSRMLDQGDPGRVVYSVTVLERGTDANFVRVQADNLDQPLDINEGAKLDLGSTAKLRTLITYLEIITELHGRYGHLPKKDLAEVEDDAPDNLTRWVVSTLAKSNDRSLLALLDAAMNRSYSASPGEQFFTGGGMMTFANFGDKYYGNMPVREAFRHSVNLVFIRMMRDIVQFYIAEKDEDASELLNDPDHPGRRAYLERFVDREGIGFLNKFYRTYHNLSPDEALGLLASRARPVPHRLAVLYRTVRPNCTHEEFNNFMRERLPKARLTDNALGDLFFKYSSDRFNWNDLGYLARVHPLELWLVNYLQNHPQASKAEVQDASVEIRQSAYAWLFKKGVAAQNSRIRTQLEQQAFVHIAAAWRRLGYPFETLVPSLGTAIGSSADRPAALAELMGIIVNDGIRQPIVRIRELHFAAGTPYETVVGLGPLEPRRVLAPEITTTLKGALIDIVEQGTAKRAHGAFSDANGMILPIGGKTGTGDHRFEVHSSSGALIESRAVNRTATFIFFIGDRFFGAITAHVHGEEADDYHFTSALPAQLLKSLAPALQPLLDRPTVLTARTAPPPIPPQKAQVPERTVIR